MRVPLCAAAVAVAFAIAGCDSDSGSSTSASSQSTTGTATQPKVLHYITREAKPRNPGPHPGARVEQLIVKDIRRGVGPAIKSGDSGIFEFIATNWVTGKPLEESWHRRPFETRVEHNVVIDGWWQGIPGMRVGGRRQLIIPPSLGFTTNPLHAGETTFFDIVLVQINPERPSGPTSNANTGRVTTE